MKKIYLLTFLSMLSITSFAQPDFDWAHELGAQSSTAAYSQADKLHTDQNSNLYTVVNFQDGDIYLNPQNLSASTQDYGYTTVISKYTTDGVYQWSIPLYFTGVHNFQLEIRSLETDASGNLYVLGYLPREIDADPGPGVATVTPLVSSGPYSSFVAKYDANGDYIWSSTFAAIMNRVKVGPNGNLFITGSGAVNFIDFDPGVGVVNETPFGGEDAFLLELTTDNTFVDVTVFGGDAQEQMVDIAFDSNDNIYLTGNFRVNSMVQNAQFDPAGGGDNYQPFAINNCYDGYLLKLNSNKVFQWVRVFTSNATGSYVDLDSYSQNALFVNSENEVIVATNYTGAVKIDLSSSVFSPTGTIRSFVTSFDNGGNQLYAKEFSSFFHQYNVALSTDDKIRYFGQFLNNFDIDPGTGETIYTTANVYASVLASFDSDMNLEWSFLYDGVQQPKLSMTSSNEMFISGNMSVNIDVDLGPDVVTVSSSNYLNFLAKYFECNPINQSVVNSNNVLTAVQSGGSYQWVDCNNSNAPISGATSQSFTPSQGGEYACQITVGSCVYLTDCSTSTASIDENALSSSLRIFPNPSTGLVNIESTAGFINQIEVLDVLGRVVWKNEAPTQTIQVHLLPGQYFVRVQNEGRNLTTKLIIK
jgi:hypothetical protein